MSRQRSKQMIVKFCQDIQTYVATYRTEDGRKNVATQQNYVAKENDRLKRQVKLSWSRQRF